MFKQEWEKSNELQAISDSDISDIIHHAYPNLSVKYHLPKQGCTNLNIVVIRPNGQPEILRIFNHSHQNAYHEQSVIKVVSDTIPVPSVAKVAKYKGFTYAIHSNIAGILLSDMVLSREEAVYDIMVEVGSILGKLSLLSCPDSLPEYDHQLQWPDYIDRIIQNKSINRTQCKEWSSIIKDNLELLDTKHYTLVHGDFDPSNILVANTNSTWHISGVLDWEFAHRGNIMRDIAHMLRYRREVTPSFTKGFIKGVSEHIVLPQNWKQIVDMHNVLALLDSLAYRTDAQSQPKRYQDILSLLSQLRTKASNY